MTITRRNPDPEDTINNEWLQLIEFVKRKYGEDKADFIRTNHYLKRDNRNVSVYSYYRLIHPTIGSSSTQNLSLVELLRNPIFLTKVLDTSNENIEEFTEIYNQTNSLMKQLNSSEDNIYIRCNAVDDNGNVIDDTNNKIGTGVSNLNSMFDGLGSGITPMFLYSNIGLQTLISVIIFIIIYYIGKYIFIDYPKNVISNKL